MKPFLFRPRAFPLFSFFAALGIMSASAEDTATITSVIEGPRPGNSKKCSRVDFDHDNNGWGNGDQDAPGNSGDHNNAENGPGSAPGNGNNAASNGTSETTQVVARRVK